MCDISFPRGQYWPRVYIFPEYFGKIGCFTKFPTKLWEGSMLRNDFLKRPLPSSQMDPLKLFGEDFEKLSIVGVLTGKCDKVEQTRGRGKYNNSST